MDKETFNSKVIVFSDKLYRMAKSILLDEESAKDSVQDLYLKLWEKRTTLSEVENMSSFTMKILRNLCLDKLRKKRETDLEMCDYSSIQDDTSLQEMIEQKNITKIIRQYMNHLPELQRTIVRLRDVEGYEIKEIADITASTENAVMANLSRARQKIREYLLKLQV
jgi:RNA polymerase sigma-70 factor (ECF subfamily)